MKREQAITVLQRHQTEIRALGVEHLYLFGSTARDEAKDSSDIDLFFDYSNPRFSLLDQMALEEKLSILLAHKTDLMSRGSLHPLLRATIEQTAVQVF